MYSDIKLVNFIDLGFKHVVTLVLDFIIRCLEKPAALTRFKRSTAFGRSAGPSLCGCLTRTATYINEAYRGYLLLDDLAKRRSLRSFLSYLLRMGWHQPVANLCKCPSYQILLLSLVGFLRPK